MIRAEDAIRTARQLIGTPYGALDCINLIKRVIRTAPGGVRGYTTASTVSLWSSQDASPKYRDLTSTRRGIDGARAGEIVFKGLPLGHDHEPSHVGIATGEGTVVHSSSARGAVVETPLTAGQGWTLTATHRYIQPAEPEKEVGQMTHRVHTQDGGGLNLRSEPKTGKNIIAVLPNGSGLELLADFGEWLFVKAESGRQGYVSASYTEPISDDPEDAPEEAEDTGMPATVLINDEGHTLILGGHWRVAED